MADKVCPACGTRLASLAPYCSLCGAAHQVVFDIPSGRAVLPGTGRSFPRRGREGAEPTVMAVGTLDLTERVVRALAANRGARASTPSRPAPAARFGFDGGPAGPIRFDLAIRWE
jgi:uncharacterized OB-fold protein